MTRVLVTGATGFVGSHLAERLLNEGFDVRIIVRPDSDVSRLESAGAEVVPGDLTNPASIWRAVKGVDTVYHIAALFRKARLPDSDYWAVNHEGAINLLRTSFEAGVSRYVHCSTVGVLGHISDPPANEDSPYHPGDIYQITKCQAEKEVLEFQKETGYPITVIRPAGIYGPGDTRWLKLFKGVAKRRFPMVGTGDTYIHFVYIDDLVDAFRLAADSPAAVGKVYIIAGERYVTLNELVSTIADTLDVRPLALHIPVMPVHMLSAVCEDVCRALHVEPPLYRRRVDFFVNDRAFDISRAREDLGYSPKVELNDGIARTARWYKEQGLL
ncbi:MAG TPA: NAD-dependent epimerase/dehydratase family protein [Armatimonadota bacterium]|jgi:nucleoside-diphosphate-sugar epimerase